MKRERPAFLRIAQAIADDIRSGALPPGAALPSSRKLAELHSVHRNTALAAYRELQAEGWIFARSSSGTFVTEDLPEASRKERKTHVRPRKIAPAAGFEIPAGRGRPLPAAIQRGTLVLGGGIPDPRLFPVEALSRAYRRALRISGHEVLSYGNPLGNDALRRELALLLRSERGVPAAASNILVTRGCQMAIDLVARTLLRPGDAVAVEALGYRPAWEALAAAGARLVPIRVDAHGLDVSDLARVLQRQRLRALYLTPHHQYPTLVTLSAGRRLQLLEVAREQQLAILEDDYDHEFQHEGRPIFPLAASDRWGVVVYLGSLS
ncbi:MAG: PLP-dependent aminotransferase family protein, partial [Cyanobacteria bacterium REEB65]|nr:PLP-dependent aminotransferase family protein [Cyanobacteria bacterium REEB65]